MLKNTLLLKILVLLIFFLLNSQAFAQYRNAVFFGDSLSDTGNLARDTILNLPRPYYMNRITNGKVAIDYLAARVGYAANASFYNSNHNGGYNYAYAGANIVGNQHEDLTQQISAYLQRKNNRADPRAFYFFMIGGNDLRDIRAIGDSALAQTRITQAVTGLMRQITRLYQAGARYIMVVNIPDIGRIPETRNKESDVPGIVLRARRYTQNFNQLLQQETTSFKRRYAHVTLMFVDIFQYLDNVMRNASLYGFTNTTQACFNINGGVPVYHAQCNFNSFVYFDNLHPTAKTHKLISDKIIQALIVPNFSSNPGGGGNTGEQKFIITPILQLLLDDDA